MYIEKLNISGIEFKGGIEQRCEKDTPWGNGGAVQHHKVFLSRNDQKTSFDFWASIAEPWQETEDGLKTAIQCFIQDGLSANEYSLDEFANEFGYSNSVSKAIKVYKACKRAYTKLEKLFSYDEMIEIINFLNENY